MLVPVSVKTTRWIEIESPVITTAQLEHDVEVVMNAEPDISKIDWFDIDYDKLPFSYSYLWKD